MVQHHKPECPVEIWITAFKVKVTAKVQNVSECLADILQAAEHDMVM